MAAAAPAQADADGPDFYRVTGLMPGTALLMYEGPGAATKMIGVLAHDAVRLKNLGCKGGMNIVQWEKATPAERKAARYRRWCKVSYKGKTGWVNGGYLRE